jgi:uncharacterized membrane protein YhaH (DUF805 family)
MLASIAADTSSLDFIDERQPWCVRLEPRGRTRHSTCWRSGIGPLSDLDLIGHLVLGILCVWPGTVQQIVNVPLTWPPIATTAHRWHDRDKSGWWALLLLIQAVV